MSTVKNTYPSPTSSTGGLTSLASSSTWLAGYIWAYVDNSSLLYPDYRHSGKITVSGSVNPTVNTEIRVYLIGSNDNSTWPDGASATPGALTLTSEGVRDGFAKLASRLLVDATTQGRGYPYDFNALDIFGGSVPKGYIMWVAHNTGTALNATGSNHTYLIAGQYPTIS